MAWFLALQGTPTKVGQSLVYELHESADHEKLAQEMVSSATLDRVVAIPAVFQNRRDQLKSSFEDMAREIQHVIEQMSDEERRQMLANNPLVNALTQAAKQQQQNRSAQGPTSY